METTIKTLNTSDLERVLGNMGLPVAFNSLEISPSSILYHFDLKNPLHYTKLAKITKCLTTVIHKPIKVVASDRASFCLSIMRDKRDFPTFKSYNNALQDKPAGEFLFGIDERGNPVTRNIRDTKSILIGGASGGGKSVYLSNMISSLLCYSKPSECGIVLIDLKRCEFELFKNADHLVTPVQFDYDGAYNTLCSIKKEIERRYVSMQAEGIRKATVDKYPLLITFIDEYAELASHSNKNELDKIVSSIASTGRACNVFIVIATQHAISSIISNTIKSNLQTRIGLRTTNIAQSACILNARDCIDLLGYGDSYISFDGVAGLQRVQGCFIDEGDINIILRKQNQNPKTFYKPQNEPKLTVWQKFCKMFNELCKKPYKTKLECSASQPFITSELNYIDCCIDDDNE